MKCYASRTGTKRNLAALRVAGWGLLVSRAGEWRTEGFEDYVLDNGAWSDFQADRPFDDEAFERLIDRLGARAAWIVLPDIVAGGLASLVVQSLPFGLSVGASGGTGWHDRRRYCPFHGVGRWGVPWRFYRMEDFNNGTVGGILPASRIVLPRGPRELREAHGDGRGGWGG